ncbi:MAG: glycine cleavage system protein GcvH [Firmicutes bacterium]|nr:glycine cleavage system protein GcvH [Bacillota bacterium]MDD4263887.1 glycine cleavage system protein GcvH [Bacillota bacterium]MDD4693937.1 glycine cleavage system protein GcvH [Bacillota bacterium]
MSKIPSELRYTRTHEWVKVDGDKVIVGITDYAQSELGDVVFVELPSEGDDFEAGSEIATIESVKGVSEIYAPADGVVVEVNEELENVPELINEDPYKDGWVYTFKVEDMSVLEDLLTADEYEAVIKKEE